MRKVIFIFFSFILALAAIQGQNKNNFPIANFGPPVMSIGNDMPDALLQDTLRQNHRLSEYLGKYILLNFWNLHCGSCLRALPELKEISEKYKDRITIISINTDIYRYSFRKGTAVKKITWPSLWNGEPEYPGIASRYNVTGIPAFVWISPSGTVLDTWSGYGEGSIKRKLEVLLDPLAIVRGY